MVVLLVGERYGQPQESGLSPTHEEYEEARERKPVLTFVQRGARREVRPDPAVRRRAALSHDAEGMAREIAVLLRRRLRP